MLPQVDFLQYGSPNGVSHTLGGQWASGPWSKITLCTIGRITHATHAHPMQEPEAKLRHWTWESPTRGSASGNYIASGHDCGRGRVRALTRSLLSLSCMRVILTSKAHREHYCVRSPRCLPLFFPEPWVCFGSASQHGMDSSRAFFARPSFLSCFSLAPMNTRWMHTQANRGEPLIGKYASLY